MFILAKCRATKQNISFPTLIIRRPKQYLLSTEYLVRSKCPLEVQLTKEHQMQI